MDARRSNWDGLQGGFCSKYRDICKKTNAADRPIRVIARRDELIRASLVSVLRRFPVRQRRKPATFMSLDLVNVPGQAVLVHGQSFAEIGCLFLGVFQVDGLADLNHADHGH